MRGTRSFIIAGCALVVAGLGTEACGSDGASSPARDSGVDSGGSGGSSSGGSGGTSLADADATDAFSSAWKQAASSAGVESQSGGVPAPAEQGAPLIVGASGDFSEQDITFQVSYRSDEAIRAAFVGPIGAGYRFRVLATAPASSAAANFEFSISLPSDLQNYAADGVTLELALAIEDVSADVSNNVILELVMSLTAAGGVQGRVDVTTFCDPSAPPHCHSNTAVSCAADGASFNLNTCLSPAECLDGACICPIDSCAAELRECGMSTCGANCGNCPTAADPLRTFCNSAGVCTEDPAVVGCSDGTREGFTDHGTYPHVASCRAAWDATSLRASYSSARPCGNSLGKCTAPGDACANGWHPCLYTGQTADLRDRLSNAADCLSTIAGTGRFLVASSIVNGQETNCTLPLPCNSGCTYCAAEAMCCGSDCRLPGGGWDDCIWLNQTPGSGTAACGNVASVNDGILCCKDVLN